jgi:hypothetical protein
MTTLKKKVINFKLRTYCHIINFLNSPLMRLKMTKHPNEKYLDEKGLYNSYYGSPYNYNWHGPDFRNFSKNIMKLRFEQSSQT